MATQSVSGTYPSHNLMSNVMASYRQKTPEVGMGATRLGYTDRQAGTIVAIRKNKKDEVVEFDWQRDTATRTDDRGMGDSQEYAYTPNTDAVTVTVTIRKNGRWMEKGTAMKNGTAFVTDTRDEFYDFSF